VPVYQPTAMVGNSRVLATLGARGELMSFFYPHIDFAQNLREGMPALYLQEEGGGRLSWTFDDTWRASQRYLGATNIVETTLQHEAGMEVQITDLVHPREPALVRRYAVTNRGDRARRAKLFQYLALQIGESTDKNAVHLHPDRELAVAYRRGIVLAIGSNVVEEYGCGRYSPGSANSCKIQMSHGQLARQEDEIGNVDLAFGWSLSLRPGETETRDLIVAGGADEPSAANLLAHLRTLDWHEMSKQTRSRCGDLVTRAADLDIPAELLEEYHRCLLALDLLVDADAGSVLAAPEFDPMFERSGGYGYCWPRDAVEVCLALDAAGCPEYMDDFLAWAERTQAPGGYWEQRYWVTGDRAPSWCTGTDKLQIDQTASVLFAMGRRARALEGMARVKFLASVWDSARAAARYLAASLSPQHLHRSASDLWETFRGSFTYSNAAIGAALHEAAELATMVGSEQLAAEWEEQAGAVREAVLTHLRHGESFARGLDAAGHLDTTADASLLGLITPFAFLRLERPEEAKMARELVAGLVRRLGRWVDGAETLRRFEGDAYAGGAASAVTTLWLARALLALAHAWGADQQAAGDYRARAIASMRAVIAHGTPTGLLPEVMGRRPGDYWAVPHAWAMASFVTAAVALNTIPPGRTGP
jgi:oligosaccharide amylase